MTILAFTGIDRGFNAAVVHIAGRLWPRGYAVGPNAPDCLAALVAQHKQHGRVRVSREHSDHTIFGDREVNWAFRAWHDWCHLTGGHEFDLPGEYAVSNMQAAHVQALYGREMSLQWWPLIDAEINGQAKWVAADGIFPTDQVAFDLRYIRRVHPHSIYAKG